MSEGAGEMKNLRDKARFDEPGWTMYASTATVCAALLAMLALQGCGAISYVRAGALDQARVKKQHRACGSDRPVPSPQHASAAKAKTKDEGRCDRELVMVTRPPLQLDSASLPVPPASLPALAGSPAAAASTPTERVAKPAVKALRSASNTFELARVLLPMAYLANVVYHDHEVNKPKAARSNEAACKRHQPFTTHPLERDRADQNGGWQRWPDSAACAAQEGLFYDTFFRGPLEGNATTPPLQVAIVFRGTENTLHQFGHDWTDNFTSSFGIVPRQYALAIESLKATMASITAKTASPLNAKREVEIYAVGHSLGGGLAQQAGYLYDEIDAVFAFNTSPVTNWTQLYLWNDELTLIKNHNPVVFRVEQQGEFLDYLRFLTTRTQGRMLGRTDIEFNFGSESPVGSHSMAALTCHLAVRAAALPTEVAGPLGYTPQQAQVLAATSPIEDLGCSAATLMDICRDSQSYLLHLTPKCPKHAATPTLNPPD